MTQEDKQLLLQDLCARLPYGVKVWYKYYSKNVTERFATSIRLVDGKIALSSKFNREGDWYPIEEANELLIKPYLRPMSSMTEEEKDELCNLCSMGDSSVNTDWEFFCVEIMSSHPRYGDYYSTDYNAINWLNKNMFDYRGLIPKGLAIEAPEEIYKN